MSVVVIGLNHRTMPLDLFERMTVDGARLPKALHDLGARDHVGEVVVLSTCNRTEVYVIAERFHGAYADVRNFLSELAFVTPDEFADHLYVHYDAEAIRHLFSVAAGLDSAVIGEAEILGQVRSAWEKAGEEGSSGPVLNLLFRHALETGKRARTETSIARGTASVSHAAVEMAAERLGDLAGKRVLIMGAGEMAEGMATALQGAGVADVLVANRTWRKARALADRIGGQAVRLSDLSLALLEVDLLLTSTGATVPVVERDDFAPVMAERAGRPLLIVDIAVPRDVDPTVADLPGVTLLNIDDLRRFAQAGVERRSHELAAVETIIDEELARFRSAASARAAAPLISSMHASADRARQAELDRFAAKLDGLDPKQREAVAALTKGLVAKLLHQPTVTLKDTAGSATGERLADAARQLFDLDDPASAPMAAEALVRCATRGSPLAIWQASHVAGLLTTRLPGLEVEVVVVDTEGDRRLDVPISSFGGKGIFAKEVQQAVIDGRADFAVHSAKDLPSVTVPGLALAAVPERGDPRDALVGGRLADLAPGATVATGSQRRRVQLAQLRPDLLFTELRGNMATRLSKVPDGGAIVVAAVALARLQLADHLAEVLSADEVIPQVGQGALAIECRADDEPVAELLRYIEHEPSRRRVDAERAFLAELGGDCDLPAGAHATFVDALGDDLADELIGGSLRLSAILASDGTAQAAVVRTRQTGDDPVELGTAVAKDLRAALG